MEFYCQKNNNNNNNKGYFFDLCNNLINYKIYFLLLNKIYITLIIHNNIYIICYNFFILKKKYIHNKLIMYQRIKLKLIYLLIK